MSSLENILSASNGARPRAGIIQRCLEKYFRDPPPPPSSHESLACTLIIPRGFSFVKFFPLPFFPPISPVVTLLWISTITARPVSRSPSTPSLERSGVCDDSFCNIGGGGAIDRIYVSGSCSLDVGFFFFVSQVEQFFFFFFFIMETTRIRIFVAPWQD